MKNEADLGCLTRHSVEALLPNPNNSRNHSKHQIRQIANSIREFGFVNPILIDAQKMVIAGHGRLLAAKQIGMLVVPTICIDHLTPYQIRAYVIADNKLAENAGWNRDVLSVELQHLINLDTNLDVTVTGFEMPEIDLLLQDPSDDASINAESFDAGPLQPAVSKTGVLWKMGPHKLFCGDSLQIASYVTLMGTDRARMIFTDAPYNVRVSGHVCGNGQIKHREFAMGSGEMTSSEFTDFLRKAFAHLAAYSHDGALAYLCMDWRHLTELMAAAQPVFHELKNLCVWNKQTGGMGSLYRSQHELIFVFKNGTAPHTNNVRLGKYGRNRTNVWSYPGMNSFGRHSEEGPLTELHPTVKPVAMVADAILDCTARGDIVLDAFTGSGSTLIAAERVGRVFRGIEIDPNYVDVAIRRWQKLTGDSAIDAMTGQRFEDIAASLEVSHG